MAEGLSGRKFANLVKHKSTAAESDVNTIYGNVAAGQYVSAGWVNLDDGDYGHLRVDADGYLLTRADTELTLSGVTIDNVKVFSTDGTAANSKYALVNASSIPYSIITNADASASAIPVAGNTVGVADIALPVADANVLAALGASDYTDDSNEFTPATSLGVAIMGVQTADTVDAGDVGAFGMTIARAMYTDTSSIGGTAVVSNGGNRAAGVQTVTLADDDPAVVDLAAIELVNTDIKNAVELIDDAVYADSAAFTVGSSKGIALLGQYHTTEDTAGDGEVGALHMTSDKHLKVQADGYDVATDSQKVFEVSPISEKYVSTEHVTAGAATASYYINMEGYSKLTLQFQTVTDCTATINFSVDPDEDGADAGDYIDVTNTYTGAATITAQSMVLIDTPSAIRWVKITATDTGAMDFTLYSMKSY